VTASLAQTKPAAEAARPITMFGPDFPFAYDDHLGHPAGLGQVPAERHGTEVAIIGAGIAGLATAYELMKLGLKPVVYEAARIGGRLRSQRFGGTDDVIAELGAMRFPPSSTTLDHYFDLVGLETRPFPNPLAVVTPSTVIELEGEAFYAEKLADLPPLFHEVAQAWREALEQGASFGAMQQAIAARDVAAIKAIWDPLIAVWDERTFYGFIATSEAFGRRPFRDREVFGQVGFGTGGWDTDFPNSMLEILRVVYTNADEDHRTVVGGAEQLPLRLWRKAPERIVHWPPGTTLEMLNGRVPRPGVIRMALADDGRVALTDRWGDTRAYDAVVSTCQTWLLSTRIHCEERLFPAKMWTAIEKTHYMQASKTFVMVDRPFWKQRDPRTRRYPMSMTLSDRMTRGTYLLDQGDDQPAVICLSYTWNDDALKWLPLPVDERVRLMLHSLKQIYPEVDIARHIVGDPITVSWEHDPNFMGAFKANLPGHYRYQRRLFCHFIQDHLAPEQRGVFVAGDDISWTAGWAEGAVQTALNAVWGVVRHLGGRTDRQNPGPGDVFPEIAPLALADA
jgi:monoamine oxidase